MQVPQSIIYLYSKYSQYCTSFNELLTSSGIDYILPVCIDNKEVRVRILQNNSLAINLVPCLLFVYPGGQVEKYEGENCFQWINNIISKSVNEEPVLEPTYLEEKEEVEVIKKVKKPKKKKVIIEEEVEEENSNESDYQSNLVRSSNAIASKEVEKNKIVKQSEETKILDEDLGLESRPRETGKSSGSLIDLDEILGDDRRPNEKLPIKGLDKGGSLMARAQEMQKSREQEDVKSPFKN